jgi:hypothetical protein
LDFGNDGRAFFFPPSGEDDLGAGPGKGEGGGFADA